MCICMLALLVNDASAAAYQLLHGLRYRHSTVDRVCLDCCIVHCTVAQSCQAWHAEFVAYAKAVRCVQAACSDAGI
jgi:hypothetical protein